MLFSCENIQTVDGNAAYDDYIVVNCELNPWKNFPGVTFTKTLPVGIPYDISQAELKDVKAYIKINGVQVVPLHYVSNGLYKPKYNDLTIDVGKTYELFAEWNGTTIYASTKIPAEPAINDVSYNTGGNYLQANIQTHPNEVYGAVWIITGTSASAPSFPNLSTSEGELANTTVRTSEIPLQYRAKEYNGKRYIQLYAFDKQYLAYFNSAKGAFPGNDAFVQNTGSIGWNVLGNKVIGMFIGVTKDKVKNVN